MKIISIYLIIFFYSVYSLEFKKNSNILNTEKFPEPKVKEIDQLDYITNLIKNEKNFIIVFYADWCYHWFISLLN